MITISERLRRRPVLAAFFLGLAGVACAPTDRSQSSAASVDPGLESAIGDVVRTGMRKGSYGR